MIYTARGLKAWIIGLVILALIIVVLVLVFQLLIFLLPIILIIILLSYFFRILNKLKKEKPKNTIDVKYRIRK